MFSMLRPTLFGLFLFCFAMPALGANRLSSVPKQKSHEPVILDSGLQESDVERRPYRYYVKKCLDNLMRHGTDRYGQIHQPLLVTTLDVRTRTVPTSPPSEPGPWRIACSDKRLDRLRGCEWLVDQSTIDAFYLLSEQLGNRRYARFADSYLRTATSITCSKGFFWWGWHRYYDVDTDTRKTNKANHHEIHINRPRWERMWQIDPEAVRHEIEAIWKWHVINKETGEHNRHGDGRRGRSFPMSGGEFLYALAWLHAKTGESDYLKQALLVADHHWQNRDPQTQLVPGQTGSGRGRFDGQHSDTSVPGMLCYYLLKSYEATGEETFRNQALVYLKAYARYGYDKKTGKFFGSLRLDGTPEPGPRLNEGNYGDGEARGHVDLWEPYQLGYEHPITAAQTYAYAYQMTEDPEMLDVAKNWARWIRKSPPSKGCLVEDTHYAGYAKRFSHHGTYADKYGRTISLFIHLYSLTGERCHLDYARQLAREAVSRLYYRGLFRGHPAKAYYCSVDGVGFLLWSLVELDAVMENPKRAVGAKAITFCSGRGSMGFDNF